ncbi:MAG: hypothetical protein GPJ54_18910 [Candidatus Heimdallarchaeota archaeon]|nr:hypothetical protein [Candidatus Heimdallarchaeota archaeon]
MKKKQVKLSGKEQAKLNKRQKFYEKLIRLVDKKVILLKMNKGISFPEFDELSIIFKEDFVKFESEIDFEVIKFIEIVYYEEAHFLRNASKSKLLNIFRRETFVDNEGNERKGQSGEDDSYNYTAAFNWGVEIKDAKKLLTLLEKEKDEPTVYDLTPKAAIIPEPIHRKSWKPPRRRR